MNNLLTALFLVVVLTAGACAGFWYFEYLPVDEERVSLVKKIEELNAEIEKLKRLDSDIKKMKDEEAKLLEQKKKLQTESIPLNTVVPKLLDSTETIANKFKVKFQDIRISPLVRAEDWNELPVEMTILGTFNDIGCFLNVMEQRKIINLAAGSMSVSVSSEVDKQSKSPMLSVTLSAKVYILS